MVGGWGVLVVGWLVVFFGDRVGVCDYKVVFVIVWSAV